MNIAFIGATGMLGKPVAIELSRLGHQLTALVRNVEKAQSMLPPSIALLQGDIADTNSLDKAFAGADVVYLNLSIPHDAKATDWLAERDGIKNILAVAKKANVKRVLYLSSIIKNFKEHRWWHFDVKDEAVELIRTSGLAYTIFYPSTFMESIQLQIQGNKLLLAGTQKFPAWWIAAKDYAKQVEASLHLDGNREYIVQGAEPLTFDTAAERFLKAYAKQKLTIVRAPLFGLKIAGFFSADLNYTWHILYALLNYEEKFESEKTWQDLGKPTMTVEDYAKSL